MKQGKYLPNSDIKRRVPFSKKVSNDFQRAKDIMDLYDMWLGDYRDYDKIDKYKINYDLLNGRLDVKLYDDPITLKMGKKKEETIRLTHQKITHFPLTSIVGNSMHGEEIGRPFQPVAKDLGSFAQTLTNKKWNELLRQTMEADVFSPMRQQLFQEYIQKNNIQDIFSISPEQQQQMSEQIEQQIQARSTDEVLDFMQNDFQTPTQRQAQQLLDYFVVHQDIKEKKSQGFRHAIATAEEYYGIDDLHGEPIIYNVNPKGFSYGGSQNNEWVQDAAWAKYEQWLTIEEATQKYSEYFSRTEYTDIEEFVEPIGGRRSVGDPRKDGVQRQVMIEMSNEGWIAQKYDDVNYKTKEGQKSIKQLYADVYSKYGAEHGTLPGNYGVREARIVWRDKRKLHRVIRKIGRIEKIFWQDEHYVEQPEDLEVREVWVDEVWEGVKLGSNGINDIYTKIRPIPGQYKSIFNPFGVQLPFVGKAYNTMMGNTKNVSPVDLGKSWQKEFDTTMAQLKHDMATDYGSVFIMSLTWKPDDVSWQDWFDIMRNGKILLAQLQKQGFNSVDYNALRTIEISKAADMAHKIQLLDYFKTNLVQAMNFNETRIGSIGQYTTNQNIQQSQTASYNQTEGFFETHRKIVEKALNMFMNRARLIYRHNEKTKFILDDITRTELEVSPEFWYEEWAIEFTTSTEEIRKVEMLRQQMQTFAQNQMSFDGILQLALASTPSDIVNIMKKESKRMDDMRKEAQQQEMQKIQIGLQADAADKQADRDSKEKIAAAGNENSIQRTVIDSKKFKYAADVNDDNVADADARQDKELTLKSMLETEVLKLQARKQSQDYELKQKELKLKEKEIKSRPKTTKK